MNNREITSAAQSKAHQSAECISLWARSADKSTESWRVDKVIFGWSGRVVDQGSNRPIARAMYGATIICSASGRMQPACLGVYAMADPSIGGVDLWAQAFDPWRCGLSFLNPTSVPGVDVDYQGKRNSNGRIAAAVNAAYGRQHRTCPLGGRSWTVMPTDIKEGAGWRVPHLNRLSTAAHLFDGTSPLNSLLKTMNDPTTCVQSFGMPARRMMAGIVAEYLSWDGTRGLVGTSS